MSLLKKIRQAAWSARKSRPRAPTRARAAYVAEAVERRIMLSAHAVAASLAAPQHVVATPDPTGGIDVTWNAVPGAFDYEIDTAPVGSSNFTFSYGGNGPDATVYPPALQPTQVRVIASDILGNSSSPSKIVTATSLLYPPSLNTGNITATEVDLNWTNDANPPTAFELRRNGRTVAVLTADQFSYFDKHLTEYSDYLYEIRAIYGKNRSAWAQDDVMTLPAPPTNIAATATTYSDRVEVTWTNASPEADLMNINRSDDGGKTFNSVGEVAASDGKFADTGLEPGKTYLYNLNSEVSQPSPIDTPVGVIILPIPSDPSVTVSVTTPAASVTNLTTQSVSTSEIDVSWTPNIKNATGFEIDGSTDGVNFTHATVVKVPAGTTVFHATGLANNTYYSFRVRALAGTHALAFSETSDYTDAAAPSNLRAVVKGTSVTLTWTNNSGSDDFEIERVTSDGLLQPSGAIESTTFTDTLTPTSTLGVSSFQYYVMAFGSNGLSAPSNGVTVPVPKLPGFVDSSFSTAGIAGGLPLSVMMIASVQNGVLLGGQDQFGRLSVERLNNDGSVDLNFGDAGQATAAGLGQPIAIAGQSDGKSLVLAISPSGQPGIARFTSDGMLDPTFGANGVVILTALSTAGSLAIEPDQKILIGGVSSTPYPYNLRFDLVRLTTSGAMDPSFGHGGQTISNLAGGFNGYDSLLVQPDGKILAANTNTIVRYRPTGGLDPDFAAGKGYRVYQPQVSSFYYQDPVSLALQANGGILIDEQGKLLRITAAGNFDPTIGHLFSDRGVVAVEPNGDIFVASLDSGNIDLTRLTATGAPLSSATVPNDFLTPVIQSDGNVLVGTNVTVARYKPNGQLDPSFNGGSFEAPFAAGAVVTQADQKVVVAGNSPTTVDTSTAILIRYSSDGFQDIGFGVGGEVSLAVGAYAAFSAVALQSNGDIVAGGFTIINGIEDFLIARFLPNGTLDTTFGAGGSVVTSFGDPNYQRCTSLVIQPNGDIMALGATSNPLAIARYLLGGALDPTFGVKGKLLLDPGNNHDVPAGLALQKDGKIVIGASIGDELGVIRLKSTGGLDPTFGVGGVAQTHFMSTDSNASAIALDSQNRILLSGRIEGEAGVLRYLPSGQLDKTFGTAGQFTLSDPILNTVDAITLLSDNSILISGNEGSLYVARLTSHGLDPTFGNAGISYLNAVDSFTAALTTISANRILVTIGAANLYGLNK